MDTPLNPQGQQPGDGDIEADRQCSAARPNNHDRPREARKKHLLVALMESQRLKPQRIVITNLSAFGLSCRAVYPPEIGETVSCTLGEFGDVSGIVRWTKGGRFGVKLDAEIDTISIVLAKTGFRSNDYRLAPNQKFENLMIFEFFREGGFDEL